MIDRIAGSLESYLDLIAARQKLVASNIANLDTPGYRTRDIEFQSELGVALSRQEASSLGHGTKHFPQAGEVGGLQVKSDGNNVSLDREARLLSENAMRFEMASTMLAGRFRMIRLAIKEGNAG